MHIEVTGDFTIISGVLIRGTYRAVSRRTDVYLDATLLEFRGHECDRAFANQPGLKGLDVYELVNLRAKGYRRA